MLGMKVMRRCLVAVEDDAANQTDCTQRWPRVAAIRIGHAQRVTRRRSSFCPCTLAVTFTRRSGGGHDEMLARRRVDVVHDVRETGSDIGAEFFQRIVDDTVGLPVRAPVAIVGVRVGAAVVGVRRCLAVARRSARLQLPEVGGVDDVFERGANVGRLVGLGGLRSVRDAREQQRGAKGKREALGQRIEAAIE